MQLFPQRKPSRIHHQCDDREVVKSKNWMEERLWLTIRYTYYCPEKYERDDIGSKPYLIVYREEPSKTDDSDRPVLRMCSASIPKRDKPYSHIGNCRYMDPSEGKLDRPSEKRLFFS